MKIMIISINYSNIVIMIKKYKISNLKFIRKTISNYYDFHIGLD